MGPAVRTDRCIRRAGFTLAEMLMVLLVLAIATAMVLPYRSTTETPAQSAAQEAASDLQYAQSLAITTQAPITVAFSTANRSYTVSNQSGTLTHPMTGRAYVIDFRTARGFQNVVVQNPAFGAGSSVTFDATGAPDNAGSVTLRAAGSAYCLSVAAATGNVTVARSGP
jgi:prepilin-type N-terminal cleavage/methylation domain-containing protein